MTFLSDGAIERLRRAAEAPDLGETRYELGEPLGRGGMATVYRAWDRTLEREVALKVIAAADPASDASNRMLREARIIARLEHPGIVPVHDAGTLGDGRVYYAMKRVSGRRLDEIARDGTPRPELLRIFARICEAVAFCHAHGVLHRDLKPENVMVGSFGEVLVMDWGLAKTRGADEAAQLDGTGERGASDTAHGTILGTPGYMAPEQATGDIERVDERSDVYALGAILYFLLVGRPPGSGAADSRQTTQARTADPPAEALSPRRLDPTVNKTLEAICLKALASDPKARYPGAAALIGDVEAFLDAEPVSALPESLLDRARRVAVKYRVAIALIAAYLVMRTLFVLWMRSG